MRTINIFIAGSTEFKNERLMIRSATTTLNLPDDVRIVIKSCEDLGNDQSQYDSYIRNHCDIVVFIVTNKIGAITESEFLLAAHSYRNNKKPEILIFREKPDDDEKKTFEIGLLEGLIKGALYDVVNKAGKYYTTYKDINQLLNCASFELNNLINNKILKSQQSNIGIHVPEEFVQKVVDYLKEAILNEIKNDYIK